MGHVEAQPSLRQRWSDLEVTKGSPGPVPPCPGLFFEAACSLQTSG